MYFIPFNTAQGGDVDPKPPSPMYVSITKIVGNVEHSRTPTE